MTEAVLVAVIAAVGVIAAGLPAALIERARRENATDHAFVRRTLEAIDEHLDEIEDAVDDVSEALIRHMDDEEVHGGNTGRTPSD
jgi:predicted lipid-binding transport protein (Tim44 family)